MNLGARQSVHYIHVHVQVARQVASFGTPENVLIDSTVLISVVFVGNEISRVDGLNGLYSLTELVLDRNKIKMISEYSLVDLGQLRELHIEENRYVYSGTTQHYNGPSKDRDNLSSKGTFRIFTKVYSVQY